MTEELDKNSIVKIVLIITSAFLIIFITLIITAFWHANVNSTNGRGQLQAEINSCAKLSATAQGMCIYTLTR